MSIGLPEAPGAGPRPCCRVCGCSEDHACFDEIEQRPCSWAEEDLCTVCARAELAIARLRRTKAGRSALSAVQQLNDLALAEREQTCVVALLRSMWAERAVLIRRLIRGAT
jgi:hypothetical protein